MISKKSPEEITKLQEVGSVLAVILDELEALVAPGVTTLDIDDRAMQLCEEYNVKPSLLGYHPSFADHPYPAATCLSVNNCVQHGIPSATVILQVGDVIDIDCTIERDGLVVDAGRTVGVGDIDQVNKKLIETTREALAIGIKAITIGGHVGDISAAIQQHVESRGFSVVRDLCGHGVGYAVHEEPNIPNFGKAGIGPTIEVGHVYAIEPIVNIGKPDVVFDDDGDGYSVYTLDDSYSAHFEHTVAITEDGPVILTK